MLDIEKIVLEQGEDFRLFLNLMEKPNNNYSISKFSHTNLLRLCETYIFSNFKKYFDSLSKELFEMNNTTHALRFRGKTYINNSVSPRLKAFNLNNMPIVSSLKPEYIKGFDDVLNELKEGYKIDIQEVLNFYYQSCKGFVNSYAFYCLFFPSILDQNANEDFQRIKSISDIKNIEDKYIDTVERILFTTNFNRFIL